MFCLFVSFESVPNTGEILKEADLKLDGVRHKIGQIAEELMGEDIYQFHRAYTPGESLCLCLEWKQPKQWSRGILEDHLWNLKDRGVVRAYVLIVIDHGEFTATNGFICSTAI